MKNMSTLVSEIRQFVVDISKDLLPLQERLEWQRKSTGGPYLRAPLPLDNATGSELLITQELNSVGNDAKLFFDRINVSRTAGPQDRPIYCSAATSGVGKTHLAYATGKYLTMILIRVASGLSVSSPFSSPWQSLIEILLPLNQKRETEMGSGDISETALTYIKLLIYSYVDATLIALEHGKVYLNLDRDRLRELALRFHRNGRGEAYVKQLFDFECAKQTTSDIFFSDLAKTKFNFRKYRHSLLDRFKAVFPVADTDQEDAEILLICFDEIQELLGKFPYLFIQKSVFDSQIDEIGDERSRDMFYGVACAMRSLTSNCPNWTMHMTGTSLSISKLRAPNGISSSLPRNQIQEVKISGSLLNAASMKDMIQFYWDIPDNVFTKEVLDALDRYRGRPYFFVEGPFRAIFANSKNLITSALLKTIVQDTFGSVEMVMDRRVNKMFELNKPISGSGDQTITAVIPILLKSLICGTGKIVLRGDLNISRAIIDGVILASSAMAEVDLRETEPLVYDCLQKYLSRLSRDDINRLMSLVLNQIRLDSGATAEEMFCYWLGLTTYAYMRGNNGRGVPLGNLLSDLYDGDNIEYFPSCLLNEYLCQATKVVSLSNAAFHDRLEISTIGKEISSINTSAIFYDIDVLCGLDIAVVVKHRDTNNYKLVAIQSKNDKSITIKEALMTLSPGTQYLRNDYRKFVITKVFPGKKPTTLMCGPGYAKFDSWYEFCKTYDKSVGNNWIRVASVSRTIDETIHKYTSTEQYLEPFDKKTRELYWTIFSSKQKKLNRAQMRESVALVSEMSPLIFLSMSAPKWLTQELKDRFVNVDMIDGGMTFPDEEKKCKFWVPISVESSRTALIAFGSSL